MGFYAGCIKQWLMLNILCPIYKNYIEHLKQNKGSSHTPMFYVPSIVRSLTNSCYYVFLCENLAFTCSWGKEKEEAVPTQLLQEYVSLHLTKYLYLWLMT